MRPLPIAIAIASAALLGLTVWGCFGLNHHLIVALDRWGNTAPQPGKADAVLDHINRPCKGLSGPDACGTLAQINKTAIDAGDAIVRTQLIERTTTPHVTAAMDQFGAAAVHLSGTADALSKTAQAGTGTLNAATDTLGEGKRTIAAAQPLFASLTHNSDDINTFIKENSPALHLMIDNTTATTKNVAGITGSLDKIGAHLEKTVDTPAPLWKQVVPAGDLTLKLWACAWHHVCVN